MLGLITKETKDSSKGENIAISSPYRWTDECEDEISSLVGCLHCLLKYIHSKLRYLECFMNELVTCWYN